VTGGRLVPLALPPGREFLDALERAWSAGDAVLPLDPLAPRPVRDAVLARMRPDLALDEPGDDQTALVIATSGSTGEPKGTRLSHRALEASARATAAGIGVDPSDRWLSCLPWHHIAGLQVALRARLLDLPLTVHERFDVEAVAGEREATLVSVVPTQLSRLLDAAVDLTHFRVVLLGGAAAPDSLLVRARDAGVPVVTTYGMSETCGGCVYDGRPLEEVAVRVENDDVASAPATGRVWLRGPMLMTGYRLDPKLTRQTLVDGWLRTEDLGSVDAEGNLSVLGRTDDVIVTGGEKVVAAVVAATLAEHPLVADAAVAGVTDGEWGQRVVAVVVPHDGVPSLAELRDWVRDRAGAASAPRDLVLVDAIPRLRSGKPDRLAVAALARGAAQAAEGV
jgi:O-succinylbenzoic acid--CoA ligase